MKIAQILEYLNTISPFELQEKWDNSGLLVGSANDEVCQIVLTLDVTKELCNAHPNNTLFIAHHPLIFSGLKSLDFQTYPANVVQTLVQKNQSVIAMHTNADKTHLNRYVFEKVLGFEIASEDEFMLRTNVSMDKKTLYAHLQKTLGLQSFRVVNEKETIESIALTTGSGSSMMDMCGCDCFLTGDIKYHDAIKAQEQELMVVDINHFESELFFAQAMMDDLEKLEISVIISNSKNPFKNITL